MKRTLLFALSLLVVVACSKFDDSAIWEELNKHEDRIVKLETLCNQMNTNIASLQTIIIALQSNDYVVNIAPIKEGNKEIGYTITFSKSGSITIYHGKDGENGKDGVNGADGKDGQDGANGTDGKDGADGEDGKDGYTPKIGVKQHTDGEYYWTLDGNWLLDDNGNMIPTTGEDGQDGVNGADGKDGLDGEDGVNGTNGKDGQDGKDGEDGQDGANGIDGKDGKDGITPQLKIEDGYWYLSYDYGATWQKLGKATGNNGLDGANGADGEDGDSIIDSITQDDDNVYFNLTDGQILTIQKMSEKIIYFSDINVKLICLEYWDTNNDCEISISEASAVTSLGQVFTGESIIMFNELRYFTGLNAIDEKAFDGCKKLRYITLPENIEFVSQYAFRDCILLKKVHIPEGVKVLSVGAFEGCSALISVTFGENSVLEIIDGKASVSTSSTAGSTCKDSHGAFAHCKSLESISLPISVKEIGEGAFWGCSSLKNINLEDLKNLNVIKGGSYCWSSNVTDYSYCGAFTGCTSLENIVLPESITKLEAGIFAKCDDNLKIYFTSSMPCEIGYYTFGKLQYWQSKQKWFSVYVPEEAVDTYKADSNWSSITIYGY